MDSCIFCKIIRGEIPAKKYYEDDNFIVIADISPQAKSHYLAIVKSHYPLLVDMSAKDSEAIGKVLATIPKVVTSLGITNGYRLIINQGKNAHQSVGHLHIHILGGEDLGEQIVH